MQLEPGDQRLELLHLRAETGVLSRNKVAEPALPPRGHIAQHQPGVVQQIASPHGGPIVSAQNFLMLGYARGVGGTTGLVYEKPDTMLVSNIIMTLLISTHNFIVI